MNSIQVYAETANVEPVDSDTVDVYMANVDINSLVGNLSVGELLDAINENGDGAAIEEWLIELKKEDEE